MSNATWSHVLCRPAGDVGQELETAAAKAAAAAFSGTVAVADDLYVHVQERHDGPAPPAAAPRPLRTSWHGRQPAKQAYQFGSTEVEAVGSEMGVQTEAGRQAGSSCETVRVTPAQCVATGS